MRQEIQSIEEVNLPNGSYIGKMGGYEVIVNLEKETVRFKTNIGVKGINIPCHVGVVNKIAKVLI